MKRTGILAAVICAATVCGASRIEDVIALKEAIDKAKAAGERFEVKPTGDAVFVDEIAVRCDAGCAILFG